MKRVFALVALTAVILCRAAAFGGQLGPPGPPGGEDQRTVQAGYFLSSLEMEPRSSNFSRVTLDQNQFVLSLAGRDFGFTEGWGGFLGLGASDIDDGRGFSDGYKPFVMAGIRGMPLRWSRLGIGATLAGGFYWNYDADAAVQPGGSGVGRVRNLWEVRLGVAVQGDLWGVGTVYAGPMAGYSKADVKLTSSFGESLFTKYRTTEALGAYAGVRLKLPRGMGIEVEGQQLGVFSGGAALAYSF